MVNTRDNDNGISFVHSLDTEYAIFFARLFAKLAVDFKQYAATATAVSAFRLKMSEYFSCYNACEREAVRRAIREAQRFNHMYTWNDVNDKKHITGYSERGFFFSLWQIDDSDGNMYAHFKTILKRKRFGIFITFKMRTCYSTCTHKTHLIKL